MFLNFQCLIYVFHADICLFISVLLDANKIILFYSILFYSILFYSILSL